MKAAPWIALGLVGIAFAIAYIAVSFLEKGYSVDIINPLQIKIGVDHPPSPEIHYHLQQKGKWEA